MAERSLHLKDKETKEKDIREMQTKALDSIAQKSSKSQSKGGGQSIGGKREKKKVVTGREKAAIFLISIGPEVSSDIFKHLKEDEVEELTFEIARIDRVDPEERDTVLMEFQELMMAQDFIVNGGVDYAREVLERALGTQKAVDIINRLTSSL